MHITILMAVALSAELEQRGVRYDLTECEAILTGMFERTQAAHAFAVTNVQRFPTHGRLPGTDEPPAR